ncbi:MAG: hypothetical protein JOZ51_23850 [Chloroflexi bacterium]|nr:hypothetical protein [Chloroflexota bacterium]
MSLFRMSSFLRRVLLADALMSGAAGLLMLLGAGVLTQTLDLPATLLRSAGLILLSYAAFVVYVANRSQRAMVWAVILINALWAIDSVVLLLSGWVAPNALGYAFVLVQAVAVAVFAELEYVGLRRSEAAIA